MPKARKAAKKRKNAGVGVDFARVKRKVGRKLAPADNATDTRVVAKRVTLPGQSVAEERGVAVSERNLTLKELVVQLNHYAARVRKDALTGVAEVAARHPAEVAKQAGPTLEALAERAADPDPGVRAALPPALAATATALAAAGGLAPFLPLLMAHARRALTATDPATRRDGLALAACVARCAPRGAAARHVPAALAQCSAALATGERARSLKAGSLDALGGAVGGVKSFLEAALGDENVDHASAPPTAGPLFGRKAHWPTETTSPTTPSDRAGAVALLTSLTGALADAASSEGAAAAVVAADIVDCARLLVTADPRLAATPAAAALADAVGARLPSAAPGGTPSSVALDAAASLNVAAARFLARMLPHTPPESAWPPRVLGWCDAVAARGDALPAPLGTPPPPAPLRPLPEGDATTALLACLDSGLLAGGRARGGAHAAALAAVCARAPPPAPAGAAALAAQAGVLADPRGRLTAVGETAAAVWVRDLPRRAWEAATAAVRARGAARAPALASVDAALSAVLDAARYGVPGGPLHAALAAVADQLAPLLAAPRPGAPPRLLTGPLARLPPHCGFKFVDAWHYLPTVPPLLVSAAMLAVVGGGQPDVGERGLVILARRVAAGHADIDVRDAVASLLDGGGGGGGAVPPPAWGAHTRALAAARVVLAAAGPAAPDLLGAITPRLTSAVDALDNGGRAAAGCLAAVATVPRAPPALVAALPHAVASYALLGGAAAGVCLAVDALNASPASLQPSLREAGDGAATAADAGVAAAARLLAAVAASDALRPTLMDAAADAQHLVAALRRRCDELGGGAADAVAAAEAGAAAVFG